MVIHPLTHWPLGDLDSILKVIFNLVLLIGIFTSDLPVIMPSDECHGIYLKISQHWLVQVMAWCRQATSHYLSQCWPRSMSPYGTTRPQWVNSLASERCGSNFKSKILKLITQTSNAITQCEIALSWMPHNLINEKFKLVQVMAWCCQATSNNLSQCWPKSVTKWCHYHNKFSAELFEETHNNIFVFWGFLTQRNPYLWKTRTIIREFIPNNQWWFLTYPVNTRAISWE